MADVPDDFVLGRVEDVVQRDGEFDDAEAGAEMPPVTETISIVSLRNSSAN